jgi:hypothetical protein
VINLKESDMAGFQYPCSAVKSRAAFGVFLLGVSAMLTADAADATPSAVDKTEAVIHADRPYVIPIRPQSARFVRIVIRHTARSQPCIDELEVYGNDDKVNLALASRGAEASASSCLSGYPIHQVPHLNDGRYGNAHSWIAAGQTDEWAQIELPEATEIARVVISRDREGQYHDRVPVDFEIQLSPDGRNWETARRVRARAAVQSAPRSHYNGPFELPAEPTWADLLNYAFECERYTWARMSATDHLSPLQTDRPATPGGQPYWGRIARLDSLSRTLVQMEELAARLAAKGLDVDAEQSQLADLRRRQQMLQAAEDADETQEDTLYHEARLAKRRLMFRDPDLDGLQRILFVKRHPYHASHNYSDILDSQFTPGGAVCVLEVPRVAGRLEPSAAHTKELFDATEGIARDPMADFDAERIYFAYRPDRSPIDGWTPYWHVMSMRVDGTGCRQLTEGPFHDYYPCPLPDGGLAFISTRVKARFLCWRPQAFVLFRMDADGANIQPLSHSNLSEWSPGVMRDGRILWTRSEYLDKGADFGHTLWAIRPDGTHAELIYGNNTPNCYMNGREVPDSRELCCTLFSHGGDHNGPIGLIDRTRGPFDTGAITNITPDVTPHYNMSWPRYMCFRDPVPVARDYFLVSHAPADRFGLYVIDRYGNRELLYLDPAIGSMSPMPLRARTRPPALPPTLDSQLAESGKAELTLVDVYQGLEPHVRRGQVAYLRVCQEVRAELLELADGQCQLDHQPFQDWYATPIHKVSGPHGWPSYVAKASLGLVPVAEDGSATFEIPAGKPVYFEVLDRDFNELQRMRSVVQLQAGEKRSCIGCHENRRSTPLPQASFAVDPAPAALEPPPWGSGPFSYQRVVQPVLDARCVSCHDASDEQGINLAGTLDAEKIPASYRTLIAGGWVHYFDYTYKLRHHKAEPMTFGTLRSKLKTVLETEHYGVKLSEAEMRAVKCWIDLNCPLWPDYQFRPNRPTSLAGLGER